MIKEEPNRDCYYYNFGGNPNFEYHCPAAYGPRCEYHDKFFSAFTLDHETKEYIGLNPSCKACEKNSLEERIE